MIESMNGVMQRILDLRKRFGLQNNAAEQSRQPVKKGDSKFQKVLSKVNENSENNVRDTAIEGIKGKSVNDINKLAEHYAGKYRIPPSLLKAVIETESGYDPRAVSSKGAKGLMQLMPSVIKDFGVSNPFSPSENIRAGAGLLKSLLDNYNGDYKKALAAYNAGRGAVDKNGAVPEYKETKEFITKVINSYLQNK